MSRFSVATRAPLIFIKRSLAKNLDYRTATLGAVVMGVAVFWINYAHGTLAALVPALKQAGYTFFVAGVIAKNNERLAMVSANRWIAILLAVSVSSGLTIGLTFLVHSSRGTPEPFWSTVPTMLAAPPGFAVLAWRRQGLSGPRGA